MFIIIIIIIVSMIINITITITIMIISIMIELAAPGREPRRSGDHSRHSIIITYVYCMYV